MNQVILKFVAIISLFGCVLALAGNAGADQITWTLEDVTFDDGTSATGFFSLNVYGNPSAPIDVTTVAGAITGYEYLDSISPSAAIRSADTIIDFYRTGYDGYLQLDFASSLTSGSVDEVVIGANSLECSGFSSPCRLVTGGFVQAPEPASLAILATGLFGIGVIRRRSKPL